MSATQTTSRTFTIGTTVAGHGHKVYEVEAAHVAEARTRATHQAAQDCSVPAHMVTLWAV